MDEVNINKYLGQINPILIVPVLSAVVGAILVFVFGFKRPNEPRFQSNSSVDSLKKSKRKANNIKTENSVQSSKQQTVSSAKLSNSKKTSGETASNVTGKKTNDKLNSNNNNITNNNNNTNNKKKDDKKTEEKKSENGSPTKKLTNANKKINKESAPPANAKKLNKNSKKSEIIGEKPADFDDGNWFTVQSKSAKQKNKIEESNKSENLSPKASTQTSKQNAAKSKAAEADNKITEAAASTATAAPNNDSAVEISVVAADNVEAQPQQKQSSIDELTVKILEVTTIPPPVELKNPVDSIIEAAVEAKVEKPKPIVNAVADNELVDNAIAFDELGEWTDAKPDRKKGNKKKSRKD